MIKCAQNHFGEVSMNVTNIVSANISPRVQKEIIGFIGENVGKHRQNKKYKNSKNYYIFEKIGKYRYILEKIGKYRYQIGKKIAKKSGRI